MTNSRSDDQGVVVILPAEMPVLTPVVARGLLAVLVELTDVPYWDRAEGTTDDS